MASTAARLEGRESENSTKIIKKSLANLIELTEGRKEHAETYHHEKRGRYSADATAFGSIRNRKPWAHDATSLPFSFPCDTSFFKVGLDHRGCWEKDSARKSILVLSSVRQLL